ncbi:MAG: hypothetical protein II946_02015 [Kiritimatiellae bacterium]|nr:hypothetical protein [Kiritimatiellia bacterium]
MRKASALIVALWIIAVLSIMVMSFATEAHLQTGVNVYMRERNRVGRLMEAGQAIAEVVIAGYQNAVEWSKDESLDELLEDDRWTLEKRALKNDSKCTIGPVLVDDRRDKDGEFVNPSTVTVEIEMVNAGKQNAVNVNELYAGGDQNYRIRWEMLLTSHGVPEEFEIDTDDGRFKLIDHLIACWNDWRDEDDTATVIDAIECGAESGWYEDSYDNDKVEDEDRRFPRNGSIPDIQELSYIRGFRDYPAVLTGGVLNPGDDQDEQVTVKGIVNMLGTSGSSKINVNSCTAEQLLTIPGIFSEDDDEDMAAGLETAEAIVGALREKPDYDVDESRSWWPYKDWNDLVQRVSDYAGVQVGAEAAEYLVYVPDKDSIFKIWIVGESMGMKREVDAECYLRDNKVRYIKWRED